MNTFELYHKLKNVKAHVQTIKTKCDSLDDVVPAQYGIQEIMTDIIDELLVFVSSRCNEHSTQVNGRVTDKIYGTYIPGEDKTAVWHDVYVDGVLVVSTLTGWYYGEPDENTTADYGKSNNTAYYFDLTFDDNNNNL